MNILTIAGSDSSGGAGIQGDLQTIVAHGANPLTVVTAITAQNSKSVESIQVVDKRLLSQQLKAVAEDFRLHGIKTGLLPTVASIEEVAAFRRSHNIDIPLVSDPVLSAGTGDELVSENILDIYMSELMPLATLITPNVLEAEKLSGRRIDSLSDVATAGVELIRRGASAVLIKGGHLSENNATDVLVTETQEILIEGESLETENVHGTGCALASAIACRLAKHEDLESAVRGAKDYVRQAIKEAFRLGCGSLYLQHFPANG